MTALSTEPADAADGLRKRTDLPPPLAPVPADTSVELPHLSWGPEWLDVLGAFGLAAATMPTARKVSYEPRNVLALAADRVSRRIRRRERVHDYTETWHVPVRAIGDRGLRRDMLLFAQAFYEWELPPEDAAILTDMVDVLGDGTLQLFGWLRAALCRISDEPYSAIASPTGNNGDDSGGPFEPHSDMWIPALLFNVYEHVVEGQGASTMLPMERAFDLCADAGVPDDIRAEMRDAIVEAGECDYFNHFNGLMYHDDRPWAQAVKRALTDASIHVPLARGQGYLTNDRTWLHGRTALSRDALPPELRDRRLHRLAYNNRRLQEAAHRRKIDWKIEGRVAKAC